MNKRCLLGFPGEFDSGSCKKKSFFWVNIQRGMHRWPKRQCQARAYTVHAGMLLQRLPKDIVKPWKYSACQVVIALHYIWSLALHSCSKIDSWNYSSYQVTCWFGTWYWEVWKKSISCRESMLRIMLASSLRRWCGLEVFIPPSAFCECHGAAMVPWSPNHLAGHRIEGRSGKAHSVEQL